jgi:putative redox protein
LRSLMGVMKSRAKWVENSKIYVDDGRGHSAVLDLPSGDNTGPTALELSVMSYAGCIVTIFKLVAEKRRIAFESLSVDVIANKPDEAKTIESIEFHTQVKSDASQEALEKYLELTSKTCPVGVLFKDAGVEPVYRLEKI